MYLIFINRVNFKLIRGESAVKLPKNKKIYNMILLFERLNLINYYKTFDKYFIINLNNKKFSKIKSLYKISKVQYCSYESLKKKYSFNLMYTLILSTPLGLLSVCEALKFKCGGKLVCIIY